MIDGKAILSRGGRRVLATAIVALVVAVGCGDNGDDSTPTTQGNSDATASSTTAAPKVGGSLTVGMFSETIGLDPIVSTGSGTTGGTEMAALYDSVMRWNPENGKYEPRTAESVSSNADFTQWTIKVKPNIKFTDGTDYDAAAVQFSLNRHRSGQATAPPCEELRACPRNTTTSGAYMALVKDIQVPDKLTLVVTLTDGSAGFPSALADEPGKVVSPTAIKQACPADKSAPKDCSFNIKPVGAGPFMIDQFKPKDSITMKRNPNYWGGPAFLDGLKFVTLGDGGGSNTYEALKTGTFDLAFLRDPVVVAAAKADKFAGYSALVFAGSIQYMNNGVRVQCVNGQPALCAGKPDGPFTTPAATQSLKVRQAVVAAIDTKQLNERVFQGKGYPSSQLFQKQFRFYPDVAGPTYDLNRAKQLVQEAKTDGWDGKIRYLCNNTPAGVQRGVAIQAMLQAAGMTVDVNTTLDVGSQVQKFISGDYDIDCSGTYLSDQSDLNYGRSLASNLSSSSAGNRIGYRSPDMDAALAELRLAQSDDQKRAAYRKISELYVRDAPLLVDSAIEEYFAWKPTVHDVYANVSTVMFFDKAWVG